MTTIAYDGRCLAADRNTTCSGSVFRSGPKIEKVKGGYVACCGNVAQIRHFLRWYRDGMKGKVPNLDDCEAIMVVNGEVSVWLGGEQQPCANDEKLANGSGWKWALAAMDHGKNALEAVEYAATRDNATGGGYDCVQIKRKGKK